MSDIPPVRTAAPVTPPPTPELVELSPGTPLKPGGGWYILGVLMVIVGTIVPMVCGVIMFSRFFVMFDHFDERDIAVSTAIPGVSEIVLPTTGRFLVRHQYQGTMVGRRYSVDPDLPGLKATLIWADTGEVVPLSPLTDFVSTSTPRDERSSRIDLWEFEADRTGRLKLTIDADETASLPDEIVLVIDRHFGPGLFGHFAPTMVIIQIVGMSGSLVFLGGVAIIIVVAVKRSRYKARLIESLTAE